MSGNKSDFKDLLLDYSREDVQETRKTIEQKIWEKYGSTKAVLIIDMSGFSLLTQRHGIVHYLSMVRRMQITAEPIIESYGGQVIKFEADNCYAMFDDPLGAVQSAVALNHSFESSNIVTPDDLDIRISCGIDYGDILVINDKDYFGNPVNCASKLGEDIANSGEILITETAGKAIPPEAGIKLESVSFTVSGIEISGFSVQYQSQG